MKIVSKANNENNSRVTIEFEGSGVLSRAEEIAKKHGCGFSHNVTTKPVIGTEGDVVFPKSFGTVSFNKGKHATALVEFLAPAPTHKVINRTNGLEEFSGSYITCKEYFNKVGCDLSILDYDAPAHDEDGNYNAIESN